jgi:disulfide bond formation protein DsbB
MQLTEHGTLLQQDKHSLRLQNRSQPTTCGHWRLILEQSEQRILIRSVSCRSAPLNNMEAITFFNFVVGIGIIGILAFVASIWILLFLGETENAYFRFIKKHSFHFAFLLALGATLGSLTYSEIFHLPPCTFCWWQRIFMYPQVIVLGIGIWYKDLKIWLTSIILSAIGACFSISHVLLQAGLRQGGGACATTGVSCTKIDVLIFGWITIPIMCLILFIGILTFAYVAHRKNTEKTA